jgi:hypothetical protein
MYTAEEILANLPDFGRTQIPGGSSGYREPILPGEERLLPNMQEKLQPALPPVKKAQMDAQDFLNSRLQESGLLSQVAPGSLMRILQPRELPYVKTPMDIELERRLMERSIPNLPTDDLRALYDYGA